MAKKAKSIIPEGFEVVEASASPAQSVAPEGFEVVAQPQIEPTVQIDTQTTPRDNQLQAPAEIEQQGDTGGLDFATTEGLPRVGPPSKEIRALGALQRAAIPALGTVGGFALGGGPTPTGVATAVLTGAGARKISNNLDVMLGLKEAPQTPGEEFIRGAGEVGLGFQDAALQAIPELAGIARQAARGKRAALDARGALTDDDAIRQAAKTFEDADVTPVKGELFKLKGKLPTALKRDLQIDTSLESFSNSVNSLEQGGIGTPHTFRKGRDVLKGFAVGRRNQLFENARALLPEDAVVVSSNGIEAAAQHINRLGKGFKSAKNSKIINILNETIEDDAPQSFDFLKGKIDDINDLLSAGTVSGNNFVPDIVGRAQSALVAVKKGLQEDLNILLAQGGDEAVKAFDEAKSFSGRLKGKFDNDFVKRLATKDQEKLVSSVFKPNSLESLKQVRRAIGGKSFQALKEEFLVQLSSDGTKLKNILKPGAGGMRRELKWLMDKDQFNKLDALNKIMTTFKLDKERGQLAANLARGLTGRIVKVVFNKIDDAKFAEIWENPAARKAFLETATVRGAPQKTAAAIRLANEAGIDIREDIGAGLAEEGGKVDKRLQTLLERLPKGTLPSEPQLPFIAPNAQNRLGNLL